LASRWAAAENLVLQTTIVAAHPCMMAPATTCWMAARRANIIPGT
jgi:hypothetical protein